MFLLGINTGLRCSDIVRLKIGTLRHSKRPEITEKKTGKKMTLFLDNVQDIVIEYTDGKDDDDWAFPSSYDSSKYISVQNVYKLFKRIDEQLGRIGLTTHTMRRTFGLWYYRKTKNIYYLMELFNHSSQAITMRYIGLTEDELGDSLEGFRLGY